MHVRTSVVLLGICVALLAATVQASDASLDLNGRHSLEQQAIQIRRDLSEGKKYSEISPVDQQSVLDMLSRMESTLGQGGSVDALPPNEKLVLFNDQERVNAILSGAREDSRLLCTRTQVTGSHRKQNVCITVAERERRRESDQKLLSEQMRRSRPGGTP